MADIFARWNEGQLDSFLIDITKDILRFKDKATGDALVTKIRDAAGQKVGLCILTASCCCYVGLALNHLEYKMHSDLMRE